MKPLNIKTQLFGFLFLALPVMGLAKGKEIEKSLPNYEITKTGPDASLKKTEALFDFSFIKYAAKQSPVKNNDIQLSYNGITKRVKTNDKGQYQLKLKPGKYIFQFYFNENHREVYTDSISIGPAIKTDITVYFHEGKYPVIAEKPVIYLYPKKTTEVSVQLAVQGNMTFTYPTYNNGWLVTAQPDGTLKQGDKTYNYLFWEAEIPALNRPFEMCESITVEQENLLAYLERTLAAIGLNGQELQDFITYWYPRMQQYETTSVKFLLNNDFDTYAHLDIVPKPDHVLRVFMLWSPGNATGCAPKIKLPAYPAFERKGFTVVEWGGMQVDDNSQGLIKN